MAESLDDLIGTMAALITESELKTNDIDELKAKSAQGNLGATLRLGKIYKEKHNYTEALKYYAILAGKGNTDAMYEAGIAAMSARYNQARSRKDRLYYQQEAIRFLTMAANNGRLDAEFQLGMIYISNEYISERLFSGGENDKKGVEYLLSAARKSYPPAQYYLAQAYGEGVGVRKSIEEEFFWLRCAQINGYKKADERIRQFANSSAANALHNMLEQIDKRIAANKDYIKVYYIAKEAKGYSSK